MTTAPAPIRRVIVGLDGSEHSLGALGIAAEQARRHGAELLALTAWHVPPLSSLPAFGVGYPIDDVLADLRKGLDETLAAEGLSPSSDPATTGKVVEAHPGVALVETAGANDLIVVSSRGRGGLASAVLGSISQYVASNAPCAVMIVPPMPPSP